MKHKYYILITGLAVLAFSVITIAAEEPLPKSLKLEINSSLNEIVCNEALVLAIQLENTSDRKLPLKLSTLGSFEILVGFEDQPFKHSIPTKHKRVFKAFAHRSIKIPANLALPWIELLFVDWKKDEPTGTFLFSRPGTYRCKVILGRGDTALESKEVKIVVIEPNKRELAVSKLMLNKHALQVLSGFKFSGEGVTLVKEMVKKFPKSVYADHANYVLGDCVLLAYAQTAESALLVEAFEYYAAVTGRNKQLKLEVLIKQVDSFRKNPETFRGRDMESFLQSFDAAAKTAETVDMKREYKTAKKELDWLMRKYKGSIKKKAERPLPAPK